MRIVYKNTNDDNRLHSGIVLASSINEYTQYLDVIPEGRIETGIKDWKTCNIASIHLQDIVGTEEDFAEYFV